jgi:hypothetical protein
VGLGVGLPAPVLALTVPVCREGRHGHLGVDLLAPGDEGGHEVQGALDAAGEVAGQAVWGGRACTNKNRSRAPKVTRHQCKVSQGLLPDGAPQ